MEMDNHQLPTMKVEKDTFQLIRVITAGRIIVGLRKGYTKDELFYRALDEELERDWALKDSKHRKRKFRIGDHVMVKSDQLDGCKRGLIRHRVNVKDGKQYHVFLYDHGLLEDVVIERIAKIRPCRVDELPARTLLVHIMGIVPAKIVVDMARQLTGNAESSHIMTQESEWSRKANNFTRDWLGSKNVRYLMVLIFLSHPDGTVIGDIYRKLIDETGTGNATASPECLSGWLIEKRLAMANETLRVSQLKMPDNNPLETSDSETLEEEESQDDEEVATEKAKEQNYKKTAAASSASGTPSSTVGLDRPPSEIMDPVDPDFEFKVESSECPDNIGPSADKMTYKIGESLDTATGWSSPSSTGSATYGESTTLTGLNIPGRLLVRGQSARQPYTRLEQLSLPKDIVRAMDTMQIQDLSEFQKTIAPNFIRAVDLIMIAPDGGGQYGKTARLLGYILPILRLVFGKYSGMNHHEVRNCSPEAIIVVNSYNTGMSFESYIHSLLSYCPQLPLRVKFLSKDIPDDKAKNKSSQVFESKMLPKGISILITTADYLNALLPTKHGADLCDNLTYIIFEELDLYMKKFWDDIVLFVGCLRENLSCTGRDPFQLAFSASRWSPEMEHLHRLMCQERSPTIIIAAVNQVLRYSKVKWVVHHVEDKLDVDEAKLKKLCRIIELEPDSRTVVACSSASVAKAVCDALLQRTTGSAQEITSLTRQDQLSYAMKLWKSRNLGVLVISDDMIRRVDITDAVCLISYDSPTPQAGYGDSTKMRHISSERFCYMWSNIRHIEDEHERSPSATTYVIQPTQLLTAHFLMTGYEYNFYSLYKFSTTLQGDVTFPAKLKQRALQMELDGNCNIKMCEGFKIYGYCNLRDPSLCVNLHQFTRKELAKEPTVPRLGEIEVRVKKFMNPSCYQVQLLRHFTFKDGKRVCSHSYISELYRRHQAMKTYYEPDRVKPQEPECGGGTGILKETVESWKIGTMCAVLHPQENTYTRGKIENIMRTDDFNVPKEVRVFCVDIGDYLHPKAEKVYKLPEEFRIWKPLIVNLILSNLKPPRGEQEYRHYTERYVRDAYMEKIFNAKIWISIGDTVWVNPLVAYDMDPTTKSPVPGLSVRMDLIDNRRLAKFNGDHLKNLISSLKKHKELYDEVSIISREVNMIGSKATYLADEVEVAKQKFFQLGDEYRWAFVDMNSDSFSSIAVMYGYNPWLFYGVLDKFQPELQSLEKELHTTVEAYIGAEKKKKDKSAIEDEDDNDSNLHLSYNYEEVFKDLYEPGLVVAVKEREEQRWMRAIIISRSETESGPLLKVFFVDYGDVLDDITLKEIFPLPNKFVNRIPFQVIAFGLDHIEPIIQPGAEKMWKGEVKDLFLDLVLPDSLSEVLDVVALEYLPDEDDPLIPCRYYSAVAIHDGVGDDLGSYLVSKGNATWKPGKAELVTQIKGRALAKLNAIVNQHIPLEEEDDDDSEAGANIFDVDDALEGFDINLDGFIQTELLKSSNGIKSPLLSLQGNRFDGRERTAAPAVPRPSNSSQAISSSPKQAPSVPANTPNLVDGVALLHPKIFWRQTETDVILTIPHPDINEYHFNVASDKRSVVFRTLNKNPDYGFTLELFGKILTNFQTHLTGQYLRITLKKRLSGTEWNRILFNPEEKNKFLKMDMNNIDDADDDEEAEEVKLGATTNTEAGGDLEEEDPETLIESFKEPAIDPYEEEEDEDRYFAYGGPKPKS